MHVLKTYFLFFMEIVHNFSIKLLVLLRLPYLAYSMF